MDPKNIKKESIIAVYDEQGDLEAIVVKDDKSRKSVFYAVSEMGFEEIEALLKK